MAPPTVVLFPSPGMGHLVSMVELGELLVRHGLSVTILTLEPPFHTGAKATDFISRAAAAHPSLSFHALLSITSLPPSSSPHHESLALALLRLSVPNIKAALKTLSLSSDIVALILDFFCTDALDVVNELSIPAYIFFTCCASALSAFLHFPYLHEQTNISFKDMADTKISFPGLPDIPAYNIPLPLLDRDDETYKGFMYHFSRIPMVKGILVNSFESLEPRALAALRAGLSVPGKIIPPIYCIGPLIREGDNRAGPRHECFQWLDNQPHGSVVFLCFGSLGVFSVDQIREIAIGLERSDHRFLWVIRVSDDQSRLHEKPVEVDLDKILPSAFMERTKERGMVLRNWAPQVEVLRHPAVGGFVTHCGWNSLLETICSGVPVVGWPLYAEQRMNTVIMVEELRLAAGIEGYEKGLISASEVERRIKWMMESEGGREVRERMEKVKVEARDALEEGGTSFEALKEVVAKCMVGRKGN